MGLVDPMEEFVQNEWWIKSSRAVSIGGPATGYDFPPHVVHVASKYGTAWQEVSQWAVGAERQPLGSAEH